MIFAKLSSKFQLSIPKVIRNNLQLEAGQQFTLVERGRIIELIPVQSIESARGMLSNKGYSDSSEYRDRDERNLS